MLARGKVERLVKQANAQADANRVLPEDIREYIGYKPRQAQADLEEMERRFNVWVMHRRFGKTVYEIVKLIDRAIECPYDDGRYAYFAPTHKQAKDIAWHYLVAYGEQIEGSVLQKGELALVVPTRRGSTARIKLYGLDTPKQRIRGLYLDGAVFDEYAWIPPSAWEQQVRPMLMDRNRNGNDRHGRRNQWCDFIFTPFGRNHAHTLFKRAETWMAGKAVPIRDVVSDVVEWIKSDQWACCILKASETGILDADELKQAKAEIGSSKYEQEMECSFDAAVEGAIFARQLEEAKAQGRVGNVPWNRLLPVNTAWDLGMDDATAIWFFQQVGDQVRFIDYYEASGCTLDHYAEILAAKKGFLYGYHLMPHDVEVRELGLIGKEKTRRGVLNNLGIQVRESDIVANYSPQGDGIPAAQALLARAVFDEERCAEGLDRLALYRRAYNEKLQTFTPAPVHDWASHGASALQQCAMGIKKARKPHDASGQPATGEM